MPAGSTEGAVIDRLFIGLEHGDVGAAVACLTDAATIWHSFDRVVHDVDSIRADWERLVAGSSLRRVTDVRRAPIPTGFVQQHLMTVHTRTGARLAWPACIVVRIEDGRIARLDEYLDRAGHFIPVEDSRTTPGLEPIDRSARTDGAAPDPIPR
ncbi:nuclear transport factor 2 family protein [Nocardia sp. NBC_01377]|uniref:nuclear transport factor 2 family protein n=1 Tax=Nocardia sp. NBC_01377 TaxID=2903595 RepID=UPI0032539E1B